MSKAAKVIYDPAHPTRLQPVEDMRIANLIARHRSIVDHSRRRLFAAKGALEDAESVLAALLEKYPNHDGSER